jgi:hypothetical protein
MDVIGALETESKVRDTALLSGVSWLSLEDENVPAARRLCLDKGIVFIDGDDAKQGPIELQ